MIASELINPMIPPLKPTDEARKAMIWMEELMLKQLPVISAGEFLGLISEETVYEENEPGKLVADLELDAQNGYVFETQHLYDVVKVATDQFTQVVAVVSENKEYLGAITISDTLAAFAQSAAIQSKGGILVLSMDQIDYSMAEISRLIESNNAKILGSSLYVDTQNPSKIKLTLKIDQEDLSHVIATLERFGYKIVAKFRDLRDRDFEQGRLDLLFKYLEI